MLGARSGASTCGCGSPGEEPDPSDGRIVREVLYWRLLEERTREPRLEIDLSDFSPCLSPPCSLHCRHTSLPAVPPVCPAWSRLRAFAPAVPSPVTLFPRKELSPLFVQSLHKGTSLERPPLTAQLSKLVYVPILCLQHGRLQIRRQLITSHLWRDAEWTPHTAKFKMELLILLLKCLSSRVSSFQYLENESFHYSGPRSMSLLFPHIHPVNIQPAILLPSPPKIYPRLF